MSYTKLLYHIVFRTKCSKNTISETYEKELYAYLLGFVKKQKSYLYRIGGMPNHIHLLIDLHAQKALSDFMRELKGASSKWLQSNAHFCNFEGWGEGYAAFTYAEKDKDMIINYICNQKAHHKHVSFSDELRQLLNENHIEINEQYFLTDR